MKPHFESCLEAHRTRSAYFLESDLAGLCLPATSIAPPHSPTNEARGLDAALGLDLETYLPGDILTKTDRASMAWGLEMRCPFLDVDLASFCISLPARLKIDRHRDKLVLREAFADSWTPSIRRRGKQGFGASVQSWLTQPGLREMKRGILENSGHPLFQLVDRPHSSRFFEADNYQTWLLLVLALWLEKHPCSF